MPALFFPRRYPPLLRVAVLVLLTVFVSLFSEKHPSIESVSLTIAYPVQWLSMRGTRVWQQADNYLQSRAALESENAQLRAELVRTRPKLLEAEILRNENRQLLALLDSIPHPPGKVAVAQVIAQNFSPGNQLLIVNMGARAGIYVGQPVLATGGVAGQVVSVSPMSSQVALLSDLDSSIPVQPADSDTPLLVDGKGDIDNLTVPFQPRNTSLKVGDRLVTSGLGGRYPPGLNVGTISAIVRNGDHSFAQIVVRPAVRLGQLSTVLMLWDSPSPQPAAIP
ncbi:rod shape-determining protein MreC [Acidithiobacillus sp.]|jgi:rod shape-determining protein MreC|uniref:rod shape-determining protein MreC n=1 Tax=Acidithiobacillus sp. TaxID=1872118 RepID=UPI0025C26D5F|nr:rod shape-determining protein MreC [Acidithiobacillus sp.]MCK9189839.1 rod shape-determining protein MreC [Acidithiobacillus sp.]MCK9359169.1 rod shape-determining protein MreC [Acidithiobacillus sp.]